MAAPFPIAMPKIDVDKKLLSEVKDFISKCATPNAAAGKLGVNRSTLWRFKDSGKALPRTRQQIRAGLDRQVESETRVVAVKAGAMAPADDEVAEIRRFCNSLLALLDERDRRVNAGGLQA